MMPDTEYKLSTSYCTFHCMSKQCSPLGGTSALFYRQSKYNLVAGFPPQLSERQNEQTGGLHAHRRRETPGLHSNSEEERRGGLGEGGGGVLAHFSLDVRKRSTLIIQRHLFICCLQLCQSSLDSPLQLHTRRKKVSKTRK